MASLKGLQMCARQWEYFIEKEKAKKQDVLTQYYITQAEEALAELREQIAVEETKLAAQVL